MKKTIKVCDCFLDVAIYCLFSIEGLCYTDVFNRCFQAKSQKSNSLLICNFLSINYDRFFVACCTQFVNSELEDASKLEGIVSTLPLSNCFYYSNDGKCFTCVKINFGPVKRDINFYCFCCLRDILQNFSSNLHLIKS